MKAIKVVHLAEDMAVGGLERNLAYIVENLDRKRFDAEVWCLSAGGELAEELSANGHVVKVLSLRSYHNPLNVLSLVKQLRKEKVGILHSHAYFANTMGRIAGIVAGTPVRFAHVQNSHWTQEERSARNYTIDRVLSRFSNKVIACSDVAAKYQVAKVGVSPKKIVTIHNVADINKYAAGAENPADRSEFSLQEEDFVVGCVARLTKVKGHGVLLDAVKQLSQRIPNLRVLLVGYGVEEDALRKQTEDLGIRDYVRFAGSRSDVPRILPIFNVFAQPTLVREGLPLAIAEAMASSLPVVATEVGGVKEAVLDGTTGLVVRPGDVSGLAEAIAKLHDSTELRDRMGRKGYEYCVEKFSLDNMIRRMEELYSAEFSRGGL